MGSSVRIGAASCCTSGGNGFCWPTAMVLQDTRKRSSSSGGDRVKRFAALLEPMNDSQLESMARRSAALTREKFGRTMRLFAPLYLSNECVNNCAYCGFSRDNPILRTTLTVAQVVAEAQHLLDLGFRNILLVAGEHPKFVSEGYLEECLCALRDLCPTLGIEVGPMEEPDYLRMVRAGCEGLVVYQETYDRAVYACMHTAGPKKDFDWRMACPERGYAAGFRRIGLGVLMGLADWRSELTALAAHLDYLERVCWRASYTVSFPRLRPAAGGFRPLTEFTDRDLVQAICAFRMAFPEVGVVVSTREPAALRDALAPLGVTHMSAGSHTEPGGYTRQGEENLHLTVRGRRVERERPCEGDRAAGQFSIDDTRSPEVVARRLRELNLEPVWKDWDPVLLARAVDEPGLLLSSGVVS